MRFIDSFQRILPKSFLNDAFKNAKGIYQALGHQCDDLKAAILEGQDQLFIDTATYMLPVYEAEFGIERIDRSDINARRNNVMAMSRGGLGTTPEAITGVLRSYGYETTLVEDFANYTLKVKFTDIRGVPANMEDLKNLMSRMVPGHIKLEWQFIYTQHKELKPYTHQKLKGFTNDYLRTQLPK